MVLQDGLQDNRTLHFEKMMANMARSEAQQARGSTQSDQVKETPAFEFHVTRTPETRFRQSAENLDMVRVSYTNVALAVRACSSQQGCETMRLKPSTEPSAAPK